MRSVRTEKNIHYSEEDGKKQMQFSYAFKSVCLVILNRKFNDDAPRCTIEHTFIYYACMCDVCSGSPLTARILACVHACTVPAAIIIIIIIMYFIIISALACRQSITYFLHVQFGRQWRQSPFGQRRRQQRCTYNRIVIR